VYALEGDVEVVGDFAAFVDVGWLRGEVAVLCAVALLGDLFREVHPAVVLVGA